jgi:hypothetical protein
MPDMMVHDVQRDSSERYVVVNQSAMELT